MIEIEKTKPYSQKQRNFAKWLLEQHRNEDSKLYHALRSSMRITLHEIVNHGSRVGSYSSNRLNTFITKNREIIEIEWKEVDK